MGRLASVAVGVLTVLLLSLIIREMQPKEESTDVVKYERAAEDLKRKLSEQEAITDSLYKELEIAQKQIKNDTIFIKIAQKGHEKVDSINNLSVSLQYSFFAEWLSKNDSTGD